MANAVPSLTASSYAFTVTCEASVFFLCLFFFVDGLKFELTLTFWILLHAATWCQLDKTGISAFIRWVEKKQERGLKTLIVGWAPESLSLNFCRVHLRCYFKLKSLLKLKRKWFQLHKCWINCSGRDVQMFASCREVMALLFIIQFNFCILNL